MNLEPSNNLGSFGVNSRDAQTEHNKPLGSVIEQAIEAVRLGTADAAGRAVDLLKLEGIEVPSLQKYYELQSRTIGSGRDATFAKLAQVLEADVIRALTLLQKQ